MNRIVPSTSVSLDGYLGTPLFPAAGAREDLRLVESHTYGNGVVLLHHERVRPPG